MQKAILKQLTDELSTPAYILDVSSLKQRVYAVREAFLKESQTELCFAMKANPFLLRSLDCIVDKFEVCSPGELAICRKANISMDKIILSGVNKSYEDTLTAMECGVEIFTVESWQHLSIIAQCAAETEKRPKVLLRLTSGNQFGIDKDTIRQMAVQCDRFSNVSICGIHYYSGTQKKIAKVEAEFRELLDFCDELKQDYSLPIEYLEYGPGLPVDYFGKGEDIETLLQQFAQVLKEAADRFHVTVEMGRFLVADCGSYVTKVVDVKRNLDQQYCIVDGGINHVNYYGQVMGVRIPPVQCYREENEQYVAIDVDSRCGEEKGLCICGSLCTAADVLVKNIAIKDVKIGDIFVFGKMGAYSITEGIYLFLSRKLPKVYLLENERLELIRDSYETYDWNCSNCLEN